MTGNQLICIVFRILGGWVREYPISSFIYVSIELVALYIRHSDATHP
jgi:hypothetical protein